MSSSAYPSQEGGGPYPPTTAGLGGAPAIIPDVPICAVLIFCYMCFAATNMTIFQINRRRRYKFLLSAFLFGFCMARIATLVLRIAWANRQENIRLAIAAQIFVNAGTLVIYIVNLILAQRILRAKQPHLGWNPVLRASAKALYASIAAALIMVITSTVIAVYTLDTHKKSICHDIQLAAITYLLIFTCLPFFYLGAAFLLPKSKDEETFGQGSMRAKVTILTLSTLLCMLIAGFKTGIAWPTPRPITNPAWYDSKECFYIFVFTCELSALCTLTLTRFDKRFWVPNGCKQAGDYTRLAGAGENALERTESGSGWEDETVFPKSAVDSF